MEEPTKDRHPLPVEVIFSCAVCQATISEIYEESNHDDAPPGSTESIADFPVTKLWLTDCCHLTCSRHLEGGGVPFHAAGERPRAACPVCSTERGDQEKKKLYGIRGCLQGSFHPDIPMSWFETPPVKLDGSSEGMEALRFHYMSLIRFATHMLVKYRKSITALEETSKATAKDIATRRKLVTETETLKVKIVELEKCEKELKPWKDRENKIRHYLGVFTEVTRENEKLREQLTAMGYAVPIRTYNLVDRTSKYHEDETQCAKLDIAHPSASRGHGASAFHLMDEPEHGQRQDRTSSSRTLSGPGAPVLNLHTDTAEEATTRKRKNLDDDNVGVLDARKSTRRDGLKDGYLVPPPSLLQAIADPEQGTGGKRQDERQRSDLSQAHDSDLLSGLASHGHKERYIEVPNERTAHIESFDTRENNMAGWNDDTRTILHTQHEHGVREHLREPRILEGIEDQTTTSDHVRIPGDDIWRSLQFNSRDSLAEHSERSRAFNADIGAQQARSSDYASALPNLVLDRLPLQERSQAAINIQGSGMLAQPFKPPSSYLFPQQHYNMTEQRSFSSPIRPVSRAPHTPSPNRQSFVSHMESVTSPFFKRSSTSERQGRTTLPPRTKIRQSLEQVIVPGTTSGTRANLDSFHMPPPPRPIDRGRSEDFGMSSNANGYVYGKGASSRTGYVSTSGVPPVTPVHRNFYAPTTPRNAQGLFQRPNSAQQQTQYAETGAFPPSSPYFRHPQAPSSPLHRLEPQTRDIPSLLLSTPSVFHLPPYLTLGSRSPDGRHGRGVSTGTGYHTPAAPGGNASHFRAPRHEESAWHNMSGSASGVSRLSNEMGRARGMLDGASTPLRKGSFDGLGIRLDTGGRRSVRR